jgi:hypothetical protein
MYCPLPSFVKLEVNFGPYWVSDFRVSLPFRDLKFFQSSARITEIISSRSCLDFSGRSLYFVTEELLEIKLYVGLLIDIVENLDIVDFRADWFTQYWLRTRGLIIGKFKRVWTCDVISSCAPVMILDPLMGD